MNKKWIVIAVVAVVVVLAALMVGSGGDTFEQQVAGNIVSVDTVWVETESARNETLDRVISETGKTRPVLSVTISAEVSGRIMSLDYKAGDVVVKNRVVAVIDKESAMLALDQTKAQLINSKAMHEKSLKDRERYRILLEKEDISEGEFEVINTQAEQAFSVYESAKVAVKMAERTLRKTSVTSPISGKVAAKYVDEGNIVSSGVPILKVVDVSTILVTVNLSEQDIVQVSNGMDVTVIVDAYKSTIFKGKIYSVSPESDSQTHTFPVEIAVKNQGDKQLKSGMITRIEITTSQVENAIMISRDALIERYGKTVVYVIENGKAIEREILVGLESGNSVHVESGLNAGESVVVVGQLSVRDDVVVMIKK